MKKHSLFNRILSGILAVLTVVSLIPLQASSAGTEELDEGIYAAVQTEGFKITVDGEEKATLTLRSHEKIEICADGLMEAAQYQWQIQHPEKEGVWINIYDATSASLNVTLALVKNMLTLSRTTQLRCRAIVNEEPQFTPVITVIHDDTVVSAPVVIPEETTEPTEAATEPTTPVETTVPTEPVETTVPTEPAETTEPTVPETTAPVVIPEETVAPTEETIPVETTVPTEATEPVQTEPVTEPAPATEPAETVAPTEPAQTTPATEPVEAVTVTEPVQILETVAATEPAAVLEENHSQAGVMAAAESAPAEIAPVETVAETAPVATEPEAPIETQPAEEQGLFAALVSKIVETNTATAPAALDVVDPENSEFVTVTVKFLRYDFYRDALGNLVKEPVTAEEIAAWTDPWTNPQFHGGYLLEQEGTEAFTHYQATLQKGTNLKTDVPVPTLVGYKPRLGDGTEIITKVQIDETNIEANIAYTVKYKPAEVKYAVRYYFQNIYDDLYVENTELKITSSGFTGSMPPDSHMRPAPENVDAAYPDMPAEQKKELKEMLNGFTPLYHQPDFIAADGSTVFEVYFEREYFLMEFDCNGGYGAETLYNRYGSYINVPNPVKAGWVFAGWDKIVGKDADNKPIGDGTADLLREAMPAENTAYIAIWDTAETTYTVAYWITNADGTKSYLGSLQKPANSGEYVNGSGDLTATTIFCNHPNHTHTEDCYDCNHVHSEACVSGWNGKGRNPDGNEMNALQALGDNDPESGYIYLIDAPTYDYIRVKLDSVWYGWDYYGYENLIGSELSSATVNGYTVTKYRIRGTLPACTHNHDNDAIVCTEHTHSDDCYIDDLAHMQYIDGDDHVLVKGDGSTVVNVYYEYKTYRLKFYYAAANGDTRNSTNVAYRIVGGCSYYFGGQHQVGSYNTYINSSTFKMLDVMFDTGDDQTGLVASGKTPSLKESVVNANIYDIGCDYDKDSGRTYYYISFTARFNDVIADKWPADVFDSVEMASGYNTTAGSWKDKSLATVSAWNGEHHVWYSRHVANETIKGKYEKLDYKIVYDSELYTTYPESTDSDGNNPLPTISYLCFWENGAKRDWNVPELYRYNIYLEALPNTPNSDTDIIKRRWNAEEGKYEYIRYYLKETYNTCDDSFVNTQTQASLEGFDNTVRYTAGSTVKKNADGTYEVITPEPYLHATYEYQELSKGSDYSGDQYNEGYSVNFYYDRLHYKLNFINHGQNLLHGGGSDVPYGMNLSGHGVYVSANNMNNAGIYDPVAGKNIDPYPSTLEPNAYVFTNWYTTEDFVPGTEMNWSTTMPASDMVVYASWQPIKRDVLFFTFYDDIAALEEAYDSPDGAGNGIKNYIAQRKTEIESGTGEKPAQIPFEEALNASHGDLLGSQYNKNPAQRDSNGNILDSRIPVGEDRKALYEFIGWFYMDENNKKRFAPDSMEITRDLVLFGEWATSVDTTYKVQYVLKENASAENTGDYTAYPAGTVIAEEIAAHSSVGKTKTFMAKGGNELNGPFQKRFYPTVNSHSILMEKDSTQNNYTFEYVYDDCVYYKIRYLEAYTNKVLATEFIGDTRANGESVITAKFKPILGYLPRDYYIRKTLQYDANATESTVIEANVITFYYVKDEEHGIYSVEYYLEKADGEYTLHESIIGTDDLEDSGGSLKRFTAEERTYEGYSAEPEKYEVIEYNDEGEIVRIRKNKGFAESQWNTNADAAGKPPWGYMSANGLTIKLYYKRNSYPYIVEYREYGKPETDPPLKSISVLDDTKDWMKFNSKYTYSLSSDTNFYDAYNVFVLKAKTAGEEDKTYEFVHGVTLKPEDPEYDQAMKDAKTKSITIRADATGAENRIIFYFRQREVKVYYHAVCSDPTITTPFGIVSPNMEASDLLAGSKATPARGYRFVGWYKDENCKASDKITDPEWFAKDTTDNTKVIPEHLKPKEKIEPTDKIGGLWENHYYALFEPVKKDLKIRKEGASGNDSFIFTVTGENVLRQQVNLTVSIQGNGEVTIKDLYCGDYTVTETNWSWEYDNTSVLINTTDTTVITSNPCNLVLEVETPTQTVIFTNTSKHVDWLHGESCKENVFKPKTIS